MRDLEVTGARVDGGAGVALGGDRADAVAAEQHRGREADEAAADDQDWCLLHAATLDRARSMWPLNLMMGIIRRWQ